MKVVLFSLTIFALQECRAQWTQGFNFETPISRSGKGTRQSKQPILYWMRALIKERSHRIPKELERVIKSGKINHFKQMSCVDYGDHSKPVICTENSKNAPDETLKGKHTNVVQLLNKALEYANPAIKSKESMNPDIKTSSSKDSANSEHKTLYKDDKLPYKNKDNLIILPDVKKMQVKIPKVFTPTHILLEDKKKSKLAFEKPRGF